MNEWMNEWRVVDQRTTDVPSLQYFNMWTVSSDVSIQRRHWQPLSVHLWAYCTHLAHDVNDVMWEGRPHYWGLRPLFFSKSGVPQEPDKCKCAETGPTVFRPYPRRLESLTVCRCHYKGSTFFSFIQRPWVLVRPGFEPVTSRSADRRSPNWANQAAVKRLKQVFIFSSMYNVFSSGIHQSNAP